MDKESIIKQLKEYEKDVSDYIVSIIKDLKSYDGNEKSSFHSGALESLIDLAKYELHQYIVNNNKTLTTEFWNRVNYYYHLNEKNEFKGLINELHEDINILYSLIDKNLLLKSEDTYFFCSFANAINCLNIENKLKIENIVFTKNQYNQLINLIKNPNNYYILELNKPCYEELKEKLITNNDILNKHEVIAQYEALKQPLNDSFINKNCHLITNMNNFKSKMQNYSSNIDKLKKLLKGNIEIENLNYFYLFDRLIKCGDCSKFLEADECTECLNCIMSIKIILKELRQYLEVENKVITLQNGTVVEIFNFLSANKSKVVSSKTIKNAISKSNMSEKTLNTYMGNIRNQLSILTGKEKATFCTGNDDNDFTENDCNEFYCNIPENITAVSKT